MNDGEKCPSKRIKTVEDCKEGASQLGVTYGGAWSGPKDVPGCVFANDGRRTVYFNTASGATGSNPKYAEVCKG